MLPVDLVDPIILLLWLRTINNCLNFKQFFSILININDPDFWGKKIRNESEEWYILISSSITTFFS